MDPQFVNVEKYMYESNNRTTAFLRWKKNTFHHIRVIATVVIIDGYKPMARNVLPFFYILAEIVFALLFLFCCCRDWVDC